MPNHTGWCVVMIDHKEAIALNARIDSKNTSLSIGKRSMKRTMLVFVVCLQETNMHERWCDLDTWSFLYNKKKETQRSLIDYAVSFSHLLSLNHCARYSLSTNSSFWLVWWRKFLSMTMLSSCSLTIVWKLSCVSFPALTWWRRDL